MDFELSEDQRDSRLRRIGPITNEMARNAMAERLGPPRSIQGDLI
jgi:hypothetical protein